MQQLFSISFIATTSAKKKKKRRKVKKEEEKQEKVKKDPVYILYYVISIVIFYKFFSLDWNQIAEVRSSSDLSAILITVLFAAFAYEAWKLNRKTLDEEIEKAEKRIMKDNGA